MFNFWPAYIRALIAAIALSFLISGSGRAAVDTEELYRATAMITGNFEYEKLRGFAECLEQVLVKVSGDPDLAGSPEIVALGIRAGDFVDNYELVDRMAGIPVHDEQGTRERPHLLTVEFSREKIDAALQQLGRSAWLERPLIAVAIGMDNGTRQFVLTQEAELGSVHRQTFADISEELGLEISFLTKQQVASGSFDPATLGTATSKQLDTLRGAVNSEVLLAGSLIWNEQAFRWSSRWQLAAGSTLDVWETEGISFDAVFRRTLENTMQTLSRAARE